MKAGEQAYNSWSAGQKAWTAARSWLKGWTEPSTSTGASASSKLHDVLEKESVAVADAPPVPDDPNHEEQDTEKKPLWGPTKCCISCVSSSHRARMTMLIIELVTEYFHAENFEGVGQGVSPHCTLLRAAS